MIPLQKDLQQHARKAGLPLDTVAKDYVIGYLLAAISAQPELGSALVFKGGTALKKLYFAEGLLAEVDAAWTQSLAALVSHLPPLSTILSDLRPAVGRLLAQAGEGKKK